MLMTIVPKGQKKVLVRQCLNELGVEANFGAAKKWFKKNHGLSLADATFYHVRQDMQREKRQAYLPHPATIAKIGLVDIKIVDVVKSAKELIDKLGKEDAKKLIDLL